MKLYSNPISFTGQYLYCANPLRVDLYRGCAHGCEYCFADRTNPDVLKLDFTKGIMPCDFKLLINAFNKKDINSTNPVLRCLSLRYPVHVGGMSDPFQPADKIHGLSKKLLELLIINNCYPSIWSTKGRGVLDHLDLLLKAKAVVQISLSGKKALKFIDKSAPRYEERLDIIKKLISYNVPVVVRVQPLIYPLLDEVIEAIDDLKGIQSLTVEGLKVNPDLKAMPGLDRYLGYKAFKQQKKYMTKEREKQYLPKIKLELITKLKSKCHELNIKFYVADNEYRHLGDGYNCCGTQHVAGYENNNTLNTCKLIEDGKDFSFEDVKNNSLCECSCTNTIVAGTVKKNWEKNHNNLGSFFRTYLNTNKGRCLVSQTKAVVPLKLDGNKNVVYSVKSKSNKAINKI